MAPCCGETGARQTSILASPFTPPKKWHVVLDSYWLQPRTLCMLCKGVVPSCACLQTQLTDSAVTRQLFDWCYQYVKVWATVPDLGQAWCRFFTGNFCGSYWCQKDWDNEICLLQCHNYAANLPPRHVVSVALTGGFVAYTRNLTVSCSC